MRQWKGRLVTSNFVFDETMTLLLARGGSAAALSLGESLRDPGMVQMVRISPEDEEESWSLFVAHRDKTYSFTDCTSFAIMRRIGLEAAIATDRHFRQAGFQVEPT